MGLFFYAAPTVLVSAVDGSESNTMQWHDNDSRFDTWQDPPHPKDPAKRSVSLTWVSAISHCVGA